MNSDSFQIISDKPMLLSECPLWHPEEKVLYWIDISACTAHRYDPSTRLQAIWPLPSEPGCIAWHRDGGLIVAMRSGIARLNTENGYVNFIKDAPYDMKALRFNDGRCDAAGRLWTGTLVDARDNTTGRLYSFSRGQLREFNHPVTVSNGIAFSADSRTMFHADTAAHVIHAYDFNLSTGIPSDGRIFKSFSSDKLKDYAGRPDGAAVDSEGAYWVAMYEGGQLLRFSPDGTLLHSIKLPMLCPTMMAFGGDDLKTLFITSARQKRSSDELDQFPLSGYVISMQVDVAGLHEHPYES